jgi:hypothetical protein
VFSTTEGDHLSKTLEIADAASIQKKGSLEQILWKAIKRAFWRATKQGRIWRLLPFKT